jgi:hypothetical protein
VRGFRCPYELGDSSFGCLITYTESAIASGTLGTTSFTNALVTVTMNADTSTVGFGPPPFNTILVNPGTGTVNIAGLGTAIFSQAREALLLPTGTLGSVQDEPAVLIATLDNPGGTSVTGVLLVLSAAFDGYGLDTALGPITASGGTASGAGGPHPTNRGDLVFDSATAPNEDATFTATAPEPTSLVLLGSGLAALGGAGLFRRCRG